MADRPTGPYFTQPMFFNPDVSAVPKAASSASIIAALRAAGGWGNGDKMQIDFAIDVLTRRRVDADAHVHADRRLLHARLRSRRDAGAGRRQRRGRDRLRVHRRRRLPPARVDDADAASSTRCGARTSRAARSTAAASRCGTRARPTPTRCAAISARAPTPPASRSRRCCSPPTRSRPVTSTTRSASSCRTTASSAATSRPATHGTNTTGGANAPPYGVHLRLRADYPIDSLPTEGAQVVARAMQKYGMYHADGGNIALTAQSDRHTTAKWAGLLGPTRSRGAQGRATSRSSTTAR